MSEAWQGMNKMGRCGRVATGAAVVIRLNEDSIEQMDLLGNWMVDPRLEIRLGQRSKEGISPWKLKMLIWRS